MCCVVLCLFSRSVSVSVYVCLYILNLLDVATASLCTLRTKTFTNVSEVQKKVLCYLSWIFRNCCCSCCCSGWLLTETTTLFPGCAQKSSQITAPVHFHCFHRHRQSNYYCCFVLLFQITRKNSGDRTGRAMQNLISRSSGSLTVT